MRRRFAIGWASALLACACSSTSTDVPDTPVPVVARAEPDAPVPPPSVDADLLADVDRYLDDRAFRRDVLERSLENPDNLYSHVRLSAYALPQGGWEGLPEWIPSTEPVTADTARALQSDAPLSPTAAASRIWDGTRPETMEGWVELGRRAFFEYPLRPEVFAEHALAHPEVAAATGLYEADDGTWPGLVAFEDLDGRTRVGITCALCHADVRDGETTVGRARRSFDYGLLRLSFHRDEHVPLPEDVAERMASWGPGRADITEDDDQDPVAIPDLWALRSQSALTQAGTIRHVHPAALAIRQETQILHANQERTRPPREIAWAMAMYLYSLMPPERSTAHVDASVTERGAELFDKHCERCHDNAAYGGEPIAATRVGVDPALANGQARGTGLYRPAPLVRVADAGPYLHEGDVPTLEALLSTDRFDPEYRDGVRGPGPIEGHDYGTELEPDDRGALLAFLRTL